MEMTTLKRMAKTKLSEGWHLFIDSVKFLFEKPIFLLPIFCSWIVVAAVVLYLAYYFEFPESVLIGLGYVYGFLFFMTFIISIANVIMLEFMQQMESGETISFAKALKEAFLVDFLKVIPVAAIWAAVWFVVLILKALTSKKKGKRPSEPSLRDAARTLGGAEGPSSFFNLGLKMFEKAIRMFIFLALPAITWDNKGPFSAFRKAFSIMKQHPLQFLTTYTLTGAAAFLMALPLLPIFLLDEIGYVFPDAVWVIVIIYEGVIWTLGIYLEQMSVGLLYLWHLKWVHHGGSGDLSSVPKPHLLDTVHELREYPPSQQ